MTVVILYLTLSLEQLVRILPWVVLQIISICIQLREVLEGGGGGFCFSLYDGGWY